MPGRERQRHPDCGKPRVPGDLRQAPAIAETHGGGADCDQFCIELQPLARNDRQGEQRGAGETEAPPGWCLGLHRVFGQDQSGEQEHPESRHTEHPGPLDAPHIGVLVMVVFGLFGEIVDERLGDGLVQTIQGQHRTVTDPGRAQRLMRQKAGTCRGCQGERLWGARTQRAAHGGQHVGDQRRHLSR